MKIPKRKKPNSRVGRKNTVAELYGIAYTMWCGGTVCHPGTGAG